jgi:ribosomal protein S26
MALLERFIKQLKILTAIISVTRHDRKLYFCDKCAMFSRIDDASEIVDLI